MYALTRKTRTAFVVNWPRNKSAEDITRYLAVRENCPYEWDVKVDKRLIEIGRASCRERV